MKYLVVIPARGGSKVIPRMNMRLMNGRPLISYAIENALGLSSVSMIAVTSDSIEILSYSEQYEQVVPIERTPGLEGDDVTLDPVVVDAMMKAEKIIGGSFDAVITLQPTSPLLTSSTIENAIRTFEISGCDTLLSVINAPRLSWSIDDNDIASPKYETRSNKQQLPKEYAERGAFLVTKREFVTNESRIGPSVQLYELPESEGLEVSGIESWLACEAMLARKRIAFRVDGFGELGLGHVYRALTLAYDFMEHDIVFACDKRYREGINVLRRANMTVVEVEGDDGFLEWLASDAPDILVNDKLDTEADYMSKVKRHVGRLVSFEDLGSGVREADAVVNAIYEGASPLPNVYTGKRYVCLRDEFLISRPAHFSETARRVLITFGGTDPLDLTGRLYRIALERNPERPPLAFDFVIGPGYLGKLPESVPERGIEIHVNVSRMSTLMAKADLAISSQGRTTFELASMGVPTIVLAQNTREQLHTFAQMDNGFINLGLGSEVSDEDIASTLEWLVDAKSVRQEMHKLMIGNDLRSGIKRVKRIVLGDNE